MLICGVFYKCPLASLCHSVQLKEHFQLALCKVTSSEGYNGSSETQFVHSLASFSPVLEENVPCKKTHLLREMGKNRTNESS